MVVHEIVVAANVTGCEIASVTNTSVNVSVSRSECVNGAIEIVTSNDARTCRSAVRSESDHCSDDDEHLEGDTWLKTREFDRLAFPFLKEKQNIIKIIYGMEKSSRIKTYSFRSIA